MFRKYTALVAAMLLASSVTTSFAECPLCPQFGVEQGSCATYGTFCGSDWTCDSTCDDLCATYGCLDSTCSQFCTTCLECGATLDRICSENPLCEPTAIPQPTAAPQPTNRPSATQAPSTGDDYTTQSVSAQEQKMVNLLNQDRKSNGLATLTLDPELCRIARIKSEDMRDKGYFAHQSPTYGDVRAMLRSFGYRFAAAGENIAHHANVDKAQAAFMSSSGHRKNILSTAWTKIGIGICYDRNGYIYATQIFAK